MEYESYFGAHGDNIEVYQKYENELADIPEIEKVENLSFLQYTITDTVNNISKTSLKFYFQILEDADMYLLTDNGDNFKDYDFTDDQKRLILDYLDGSSVGINFENKLNLVYLELGTLTDDMHVTFLAKKYIDALTYINGII